MLIVITIFTFVTLFALMGIGYYLFTSDKRQLTARLEIFVDHRNGYAPCGALVTEAPGTLTGWREWVRIASNYLAAPAWSRSVEHKLIQAGIPLRGSEFLVIVLAVVVVTSLILFLLTGGKIFFALLGVILGYMVPMIVLRIKIDRRAKAFNNQLCDSLILIANSLRTGYSFMQSIEMVAREMPAPISSEFARALKEMNFGVTTEDALNNLAKRVNSDDLDLVITAVLIQRQVGGNLAEVLDNIAATIRGRIKIKGEITTLTAQGRISGLIVSILPLGLGVVIYAINPEYIKVLFTNPMGKAMLAGAFVSQLLGILMIKKIVNIEV